MKVFLALVLVMLVSSKSSAEPRPAEGPRNAVTTSLLAPFGRGMSFGYERAFLGSRLGLTSRAGMRFADGGDFRTRGYALGLELRWYMLGRAAFRSLAIRSMVGLFAYGRSMWTLTVLRDDGASRQLVGRGHRVGAQVGLGYRFVFGPAIELTPFGGFELRADIVDMKVFAVRPTIALGVTMGWLFDRRLIRASRGGSRL